MALIFCRAVFLGLMPASTRVVGFFCLLALFKGGIIYLYAWGLNLGSLWLHILLTISPVESLIVSLSLLAFDPISLCWKLGFGLPHCLTQGRFLSALPVSLFAPKLVATQLTCNLRGVFMKLIYYHFTTAYCLRVDTFHLVLLNSCFVSTHTPTNCFVQCALYLVCLPCFVALGF